MVDVGAVTPQLLEVSVQRRIEGLVLVVEEIGARVGVDVSDGAGVDIYADVSLAVLQNIES